MDKVDAVVAGAGVIGLAVARELALRGQDTLILEAQLRIGSETSSRNSEVIHAGIYYPQRSLKARMCVEGRELLYGFCEQHGIGYRRCGKLIVATSEPQLTDLRRIRDAAELNAVPLSILDRNDALSLEPQLSCVGALYSSATGILDSHAYMLALLGQAQNAGATLAFDSRVTSVRPVGDGLLIGVNDGEPQMQTRSFINCAGLWAPALARRIEGLPAGRIPTARFAKGTYFSLAGSSPFRHLVYPVPEPGGLGVHLTLDLAGRARFGPDVQWVEEPNYDVDLSRAARFYSAIRAYWPALADDALQPAYAGVRPKIVGPEEPAADFRVDGPEFHGMRGVINLFGIESPGLTASLALARYVADICRTDTAR